MPASTASSLRRTLQNARAANMPKDKVEAAIKRAKEALARKGDLGDEEAAAHEAEERGKVLAQDHHQLGVARAALELDDALVHKVVIAGTPDQVIAKLLVSLAMIEPRNTPCSQSNACVGHLENETAE